MKRIPFKQKNEALNSASFRQGLPEPRSQGRDAAHHPWILGPGNPCRGDDVFLTYRYGCVSFSSVLVIKLIIRSVITTALLAHNAWAEERITLGVKLLGTGWEGDNGSVSSSFASSKGGQLAFTAAYAVDKFYVGINLQNGQYQFDNTAPDQFTPGSRISSSHVEIQQQELDLLAGYYFWESVSLFLDLKGVSNTWSSTNYKQNFGGLGLGATAHLPLNTDWTGFGSLGFVGRGEVNDDNKVKVGEGSSGALEFGAIYRLADNSTLNMGIKFRNYRFDYLDNTTQDYSVNALFIGYNHVFYM